MSSATTRDRVPLHVKFAFGFAEFGLSLSANFLIFYLLIFLNTVAGLPGKLAGMVLLVGKIVDAVTDPMVGSISDGWKSKWGRRLPFMAVGAPLLALAFLAQMTVPELSVWFKFGFYVFIGVASQTLYSMVTIPYTSLTAELTQDYEERTSLNGFRQVFSLFGAIAALLVAIAVFKLTPVDQPKLQYLVMGLVGGGIIAISLTISVLGIKNYVLGREKFRLSNAEAMRAHNAVEDLTYLQQIKVVFSNRPFVILCLLYLFAWMGVQVTSTVLIYYLQYWMKMSAGNAPMVILAVTGTAMLMLAPWSLVSHKLGKKWTFVAGAAIWFVAQIILVGVQPGQMGLLITAAVLAGFGVSVCYLVPWAMLPDVIELDELETGQRREGIFYGYIVFLQKIAVAIAIFAVGFILDAQGFKEKAADGVSKVMEQPDSALFALRMLVGPLPMIFLILAVIAAIAFPITKKGHEATLAELKRRRGEHPPDEGVISPPEQNELIP